MHKHQRAQGEVVGLVHEAPVRVETGTGQVGSGNAPVLGVLVGVHRNVEGARAALERLAEVKCGGAHGAAHLQVKLL